MLGGSDAAVAVVGGVAGVSEAAAKQSEVLDAPLEEVVIAARDGDVDAIEGFLDAGLDVSAPQETETGGRCCTTRA